jgi:hypothetical protein
VVIEIATKRPVTMVPTSSPPRARAQHETDDDGHGDGQDGRNHHFLDRRHGQHVDRTGIIRLGRAFHDARDFLELATHLDNHGTRRTADRFHGHGREEVGNQAADEEADDHQVVGQIEGEHLAGRRFKAMRVVGEEHQRGEGRRNRWHSPWSRPWWCCRRRPADR